MLFSKYDASVSNKNQIISFLIGLLISILLSFVLVIVLACALKWFLIDEKFIVPLNLAIKVISVVIGASIAVKGENKGLIKGVVFGVVYITLAFLCFSLLANSFVVDLSLLLDIVSSCLAGGIVGIIKVNAK